MDFAISILILQLMLVLSGQGLPVTLFFLQVKNFTMIRNPADLSIVHVWISFSNDHYY